VRRLIRNLNRFEELFDFPPEFQLVTSDGVARPFVVVENSQPTRINKLVKDNSRLESFVAKKKLGRWFADYIERSTKYCRIGSVVLVPLSLIVAWLTYWIIWVPGNS